MNATLILNELKENFKSDLSYARQRLDLLKSPSVKEGAKRLALIVKKVEEAGFHSPQVSTYLYDGGRMNATVKVNTQSLKSEDVLQVMSWLEDIVPARRSDDYASEWAAQRAFSYKMDCLNLEIVWSLPTEGDACHRVQTGTKLVEQPVYKLECE